jgi:hypothetical protein
MPRLKTPRPPEETRAIVRALRRRFITPEVEATAKAAYARLMSNNPIATRAALAAAAKPEPDSDVAEGDTFLGMIRRREGIKLGASGGSFSEAEQAQARTILDELRSNFGTAAGDSDESKARAILDSFKQRFAGIRKPGH